MYHFKFPIEHQLVFIISICNVKGSSLYFMTLISICIKRPHKSRHLLHSWKTFTASRCCHKSSFYKHSDKFNNSNFKLNFNFQDSIQAFKQSIFYIFTIILLHTLSSVSQAHLVGLFLFFSIFVCQPFFTGVFRLRSKHRA